tara:strand:- start:10 stop:579 length:570 start_codon:yes stop_codon:yes gene_type:complete
MNNHLKFNIGNLSPLNLISFILRTFVKDFNNYYKNKMYNCFDVAKKFLDIASENNDGIDTMKLLKLTYIAHGYYLGFFDKPLFYDSIQAWKFGPVIPSLYHVIKPFGFGYVSPRVMSWHTENKISKKDEDFLRTIYKHYKKNTGVDLSNLTHEEGTPWAQVYQQGINNIPISNSLIKEHYDRKIKSKTT